VVGGGGAGGVIVVGGGSVELPMGDRSAEPHAASKGKAPKMSAHSASEPRQARVFMRATLPRGARCRKRQLATWARSTTRRTEFAHSVHIFSMTIHSFTCSSRGKSVSDEHARPSRIAAF
jgi:hypothetical protein